MSRLVDWDLARTIAGSIAGEEPTDNSIDLDLSQIEGEARAAVLDYTGLELAEEPPDGEWVSRREWIEINMEGLRASLDLVEERFDEVLLLPAPLRKIAEAAISKVVAIEVGGLLGFASTRVLGQYEYPLLGGDREPRLLFLDQNIDTAREALGTDSETLLRWIALHECTHSVHFSSAPWMRSHLGDHARSLITESKPEVSASELVDLSRRLVSEDPRKILAELRANDPMTLLASPDARDRIASMQATMAAVEGFAEHVMDAAAPELGEVSELRAALEQRRQSRGIVVRVLSWLLGMEMKMRQYQQGKHFIDEVVAAEGTTTLNLAWRGAEHLPSPDEIAEPTLWLDRVAESPAA